MPNLALQPGFKGASGLGPPTPARVLRPHLTPVAAIDNRAAVNPVFRRGIVAPNRLPKVTPSDRQFRLPYQRDMSRWEGLLFKADRVPE